MKRISTIKRRTELKRRKKLNRVSAKQKSRLERYYPIRNEFLRQNIWCMICVAMSGKATTATEVHHRKYRAGNLLFDTRWFLAVCRPCHERVHMNIAWAKQHGFLLPIRGGHDMVDICQLK